MFMPSIFEDNFIDNFFDDMFRFPFEPVRTQKPYRMNTDIQEFDDKYQLELELPGYQKEDIKASLKDGYLTISASHTQDKDEKGEDGTYIRRERYCGQYQRSFYVGEQMTQEDIHASFANGILKLDIPKKNPTPELENKSYISIEG